jgi:hypothetical protein
MQQNCAIWPSEIVEDNIVDGRSMFDSPRAGGKYLAGSRACAMIGKLSPDNRAKLTSWLVDQHRSGVELPIIDTDVLNDLDSRRALRVSDKKRRFFEALVSMKFRLGNWIDFFGQAEPNVFRTICAWTECEEESALVGLQRLLCDEGLITKDGPGYRLTSHGYAYLEKAELGGADTKQAFVAMWFDPSMTDAYENGIRLAIKDAGFEPFRIDRKEHNNKIDDEIVAEIRRSRFVVADFTCGLIGEGDKKQSIARGGVYYEAGFAQGLGTPVIWMARKDCINHLHFDTRQFAHIEWDDPVDLKTKLYNRIRASIPGSA